MAGKKKRLSIGTWAFAIGPYADHPVPFKEVVSGLKKLGFDGLELGAFSIHPNPDKLKTKEERKQARAEWESKGMGCSGLVPDLWSEKLITAPNADSYLASFRKALDFCTDMGIDVIRVDTCEDPGVLGQVPGEEKKPKTVPYADALKRVVSTWKQCTKEAADRGIRVVWEFEPGFAFNKPSDVFRVLDGVNEDGFKVMFDTSHANMVAVHGSRQPGAKETLKGGIKEFAQKLKGRIGRVHLIDNDGSLHDHHTSTNAPFGKGHLKWEEFMPAIVEAGCPDDWWTIDLCFWPDAWPATETCKKFADGLVAKYAA